MIAKMTKSFMHIFTTKFKTLFFTRQMLEIYGSVKWLHKPLFPQKYFGIGQVADSALCPDALIR